MNPKRIEQFNERLVPKITTKKTQVIHPDSVSLTNHWLAGFIQGDGSFQIKVLNREAGKVEVRVVMQIDLKESSILQKIANRFGGYLGYRSAQNTYYYSSVSFGRVVKFINYLDKYQVIGSTLTLYWLWRKCYLVIQAKKHLNTNGVEKIIRLKARMTQLRKN